MRGKQKSIMKRGKKGAMAAILCALLLGGCGKETAAEEMPAQTAAQQEKIVRQQETAEQEETAWQQAAKEGTTRQQEQEETARQQETTERQVAKEDGNSQGREDETDETAEKDSLERDDPTAQSVTWEGVVESAGAGSFTVSEIFTEAMEDGAMIAVAQLGDENKKLTEVCYTDQTVFTVRTTYNGGMSHSDSAGSGADLKKDVSCVLTGSWDGDVFRASEVVIYDHQ